MPHVPRFIAALTNKPTQESITMCYSLLNITLSYDPSGTLPYTSYWTDQKEVVIAYALQVRFPCASSPLRGEGDSGQGTRLHDVVLITEGTSTSAALGSNGSLRSYRCSALRMCASALQIFFLVAAMTAKREDNSSLRFFWLPLICAAFTQATGPK